MAQVLIAHHSSHYLMVKETKIHKKNLMLLSGVILLIIIGIFKAQLSSLFNIFYGVTIDKAINLTTHEKESFNIVLLGIGGAKHDGPDLSDTIIFANVNVKQNKMHMFSIPRDLWIKDVNDKINSIYAKAKEKGNGIDDIEKAISLLTGQKVDYTLVLDFEGFIKLVDQLGGIDVEVVNTLDDYHYPIEGQEEDKCGKTDEDIEAFTATVSAELELWEFFPCRYKHLHVPKGENHFSGEQALEFVRSRHGVGSEGSDFSRSRRQQLVISAIKDKAFTLGVILNPVKLIGIYNILKQNIDTNIDIEKIDDFINLAKKLQDGEIHNYVIDQGDLAKDRYGLLTNPPISEEYKFKWVLIPRIGNGDYSEIHEFINCNILYLDCRVGKNGILSPTPTVIDR